MEALGEAASLARACLARIARVVPLSHASLAAGDGAAELLGVVADRLRAGDLVCWAADGPTGAPLSEALGAERFQTFWLLARGLDARGLSKTLEDSSRFLGTAEPDLLVLSGALARPDLVKTLLARGKPKSVLVADPNQGGDGWAGWADALPGHAPVACGLGGGTACFVRNDLLGTFAPRALSRLRQPLRPWVERVRPTPAPDLGALRHLVQQGVSGIPWVVAAEVPSVGRFELEIHRRRDRHISRLLANGQIWEPFETDVFTRLCGPGDFVLDIGANLGWYTLLASSLLGEPGSIDAYEPEAANFELLSRNLARRAAPATPVRPLRLAVGPSEEAGLLHLSPDNLGDHRLVTAETGRTTQPVTVRTIDALYGSAARWPDLVKSDTQGSEAGIFQGAKGLFAKGWRPVWLLEFWPQGLVETGHDPLGFWRELLALGYETFEIHEEATRLFRLDARYMEAKLAEGISPASGLHINVLALPEGSERRGRVADLVADSAW